MKIEDFVAASRRKVAPTLHFDGKLTGNSIKTEKRSGSAYILRLRKQPELRSADSREPLCGSSQDRLRAVGTAAGVDGNLAEAFRAFFCGGIGRLVTAVHAGD
jgi:hypothetical protein